MDNNTLEISTDINYEDIFEDTTDDTIIEYINNTPSLLENEYIRQVYFKCSFKTKF